MTMRVLLADWRRWNRGEQVEALCRGLGHRVTRVLQFDEEFRKQEGRNAEWREIGQVVAQLVAEHDCLLLHCGESQRFRMEVLRLASDKPVAGFSGGGVDENIRTMIRQNPRHGRYEKPVDENPSADFLASLERGLQVLRSCRLEPSGLEEAAICFCGRDPVKEYQSALRRLILSNGPSESIRELAAKLGVPIGLCTIENKAELTRVFQGRGRR